MSFHHWSSHHPVSFLVKTTGNNVLCLQVHFKHLHTYICIYVYTYGKLFIYQRSKISSVWYYPMLKQKLLSKHFHTCWMSVNWCNLAIWWYLSTFIKHIYLLAWAIFFSTTLPRGFTPKHVQSNHCNVLCNNNKNGNNQKVPQWVKKRVVDE